MNKQDYRLVLMGTPEFAVTVFKRIIEDGWHVVGLVSQPDHPVGRKQEIVATPTKQLAEHYGIPVFQPVKIRNDFEFMRELKPDLVVTCAYGQIVPQALLDLPTHGCINVHGSLLPKLRGGAPIHRAIMNGDKETGITIMEMLAAMDAGRMYAQAKLPILDSDDLGSLSTKLSELGADLIVSTLPDYLEGKLKGTPQDEKQVTFGYNIKREEEKIDWNQPSRVIFNHIRALSPVPGSYTTIDGHLFKIYSSALVTTKATQTAAPGTIIEVQNGILVKTADGALNLVEIQPEAKKKMSARDYANGAGKKLLGEKFI